MKVTHVEDHITHAVISGAQAIDFGISDSPEFFNILSTTLYTDQILAVVRETLCNAWDAHIEFKCEDIPVDIMLTDKELVIRDYGPGIAPDKIGPIYGTYGRSTKVADGNVTGGFGLGCKSPFAYVDNFEVTSFHDGKMTIYQLSKSNAEVGGKPSIVPIISGIPTQEHGLQVKIAIKSDDRRRFDTLIQRIIQNGGMKMNLNGQLQNTLPFEDMIYGFMLTSEDLHDNKSPVNIRYGNVIYPIEEEESYKIEWNKIILFLNRLESSGRYYSRYNSNWSLVLQAEPNSISVTPSRERLSNQKHTLEALKKLMINFITLIETKLETECYKVLGNSIDSIWINSTPSVIFDTSKAIPNLSKNMRDDKGNTLYYGSSLRIKNEQTLTKFDEFVYQYSSVQYPEFPGFRNKDIKLRIKALIESNFGGQRFSKMLRSYLREFEREDKIDSKTKISTNTHRRRNDNTPHPWFYQHLLAPLIKGMPEAGLSTNKLFVYHGEKYVANKDKMIEISKFKAPLKLLDLLPFTRNIVILSFNKIDVIEGNANNKPIMKYWLGDACKSFVYVVPRSDARIQEARDYFTKLGVHFVDLTHQQREEFLEKQKERVAFPEIKVPKKTGIPTLSSMLSENGIYISDKVRNSTIDRITKPTFIYKETRKNSYDSFEDLNRDATSKFIKLFGSEGGVCVNQNQYERYEKAGAIDWKVFFVGKMTDAITNNVNIKEWFAFDPTRLDIDGYRSRYNRIDLKWFLTIKSDPDLNDYFGLVDNRTGEDKLLLSVWESFKSIGGYTYSLNSALKNEINKIPLSTKMIDLFNNIESNSLLKTLNVDQYSQLISNPNATKASEYQRLIARDHLLNIIEKG